MGSHTDDSKTKGSKWQSKEDIAALSNDGASSYGPQHQHPQDSIIEHEALPPSTATATQHEPQQAPPLSSSEPQFDESQDVQRATQASMRDAVGAFAIAGPGIPTASDIPEEELLDGAGEHYGSATNNNNPYASSPNTTPLTPYSQENLPPNIDIIAEATLVAPEEGDEDQRQGAGDYDDLASEAVDTLGLGLDEQPPAGGAAPDSASVAMSAITTPYTPTVTDENVIRRELGAGVPLRFNNSGAPPPVSNVAVPERPQRQSSIVDEVPTASPVGLEADCEQNLAATATPPTGASTTLPSGSSGGSDEGEEGPPPGVIQAQKLDKYSIFVCGHHFNLTKAHFCALASLLVVLCVIVPVAVVVDEHNRQQDEPVVGTDPFKEIPVNISNPNCDIDLFENNSTFKIDSIQVNDDELIETQNNDTISTPIMITARPGSTLRLKGTATTCSTWCPGCLVQLYISLMDYDNGYLYDPCKYMWSAQVSQQDFQGAEGEPFLERPPQDTTSRCFANQGNSDCGVVEFDQEIVLDEQLYDYSHVNDEANNMTTTYGVVLSLSYEYLCQEYLTNNKLKILDVSHDYFVQLKGDPIEVEEGADECKYNLIENDSTFQVQEVYVNGQLSEGGTVSAMPGDKVRVKGKASTCSSTFCPTCWTQLYVTLMDYDNGSLYDPCKYMWAGQVVGKDFSNAEGEPFLIRPPISMTSQCFAHQENANCTLVQFDQEFVLEEELLGDSTSLSYSTKYGFVLSNSYEWYCQDQLVGNHMRILGVSEDYFVEIKEECNYQLNENNNSTFDVDQVYVNDEPVEEGTVTAMVGDTVRVKGTASSCSSWCPGCLVQLYITLMDYDNGSLYDPCKYMWAAQVVGEDFSNAEDEPFLIRPPRDTTNACFANQGNGECTVLEFDEEFVLDAELYGNSTKYGFVLSNSYEYVCQDDSILNNMVRILGVSDEHLVEVTNGELME